MNKLLLPLIFAALLMSGPFTTQASAQSLPLSDCTLESSGLTENTKTLTPLSGKSAVTVPVITAATENDKYLDSSSYFGDNYIETSMASNEEVINNPGLEDIISQITQIPDADIRVYQPDEEKKYYEIILMESEQYDSSETDAQITQTLNTTGVYWTKQAGPAPLSYTYTIHPEVTPDQLQCEIHPTEGIVVIVQGEWALTNAEDENPKLATWGIATCQGILVYNSKTKTGAIAHIDYRSEVSSVQKTLVEAVGKGPATKIWMTDNVDPILKYLIEEDPALQYQGVLPRAFIFDTQTEGITELSRSEIPALVKTDNSLDKRCDDDPEQEDITDIRINNSIYQCFRRY